MTYYESQKVIIPKKDGVLTEGIILKKVEFGEEDLWWVQYDNSGYKEVDIFSVATLDSWNALFEVDCCCGAKKTNQPGHSYYCNAN